MSVQEHIDNLSLEISEVLDLDELEAKIYLCLLRSGPVTASAIAKKLDLDRARTYRTVDKLVSRNIVSTTLTSPKLCLASEPQEALQAALRKKQDEVNKIKKSGEKIVDRINNQISKNVPNNIPTFRVVQGKSNIYTDIEQIIENSNRTIYIVTTIEDISRMYHSSIPEKIISCEKNGGKVRLLVDIDDPKLTSYVKRFNATETHIGKIPSKGRIIVEENNHLIMSDCTSHITPSTESDFSLCTNSKEMIKNIQELCYFLWQKSVPLKTIDIKQYK